MTLSITIDEAAWQYACNNANSDAQAAFQPASEPPSVFVPRPLAEYVQALIEGLGLNYAQQAAQTHDAILLAADPLEKARMAKVLGASQEIKDALAAQVDALP